MEELISSFMTHDLNKTQGREEEVKKKKSIVLKATAIHEEESDSKEDSKDDEEMAMIVRRFKKFIRRRKKFELRRRYNKGEGSKEKGKEKEKEQPPLCYEYKELGHFRMDCALLNKSFKKLKKKAYKATWSNDEDSSLSKEECQREKKANLCLMALDDNELSNDDSILDFTFANYMMHSMI